MINLEIEEIRENPEVADWRDISCTSDLSEEFIREFADRVDWEDISFYQTLGEEFIREFADRVDWENIIFFQEISQNFMLEMMNKIQPIISEEELVDRCQELDYTDTEVETIKKYYRLCQIC